MAELNEHEDSLAVGDGRPQDHRDMNLPNEEIKTSQPAEFNPTESTQMQTAKYEHEIYPRSISETKGSCLIINSLTEDKKSEVCKGASADENLFKKTFENLNYRVDNYHPKSTEDLRKIFEESVKEKVRSGDDSLIICIISHGGSNFLMDSNNFHIPFEFIITKLNPNHLKELKEKPKLLFFVACRGNKIDHGFSTLIHTDSSDYRPVTRGLKDCYRPVTSDFLMAFGVFDGYQFKMKESGSRFANTLCDVIETVGHQYCITELLAIVNNHICDAAQVDNEKRALDKRLASQSEIFNKYKLIEDEVNLALDKLSKSFVNQKIDNEKTKSTFLEVKNELITDRQEKMEKEIKTAAENINENPSQIIFCEAPTFISSLSKKFLFRQ